jgi:hypothetical protein
MYWYQMLQHSCPVVAVLSMFIVLSCHCKLVHVMCTFIPFLSLQSCSPHSTILSVIAVWSTFLCC